MEVNMKKFYILMIALFMVNCTIAQNPQWINYTNGNQINALLEEGNTFWIGTTGGLVLLDKTTGTPTFFNKVNPVLPDIKMPASLRFCKPSCFSIRICNPKNV
jgi:hypothetical protein